MPSFPRSRRTVLSLLGWLVLTLPARGDGCVIDYLGRYVPEQEQLAFIEWQDGRERLYVGTRTAVTEHSSLWIVPVQASPDQVQAEPVDTAPQVVYYQPLAARARDQLRDAVALTVGLDTGLFPCVMLAGASCASSGPDDVREYQRVEKLGMTVVVLTARSAEALDDYLVANGVRTTAANLVGLQPYLGQQEDHALVCAWLREGNQKSPARAVRIDFPTPALFYPLRPSSVYTSEVRTVVYVRGLVQPAGGVTVPGLECDHLWGRVQEVNLGYSFAHPPQLGKGYLGSPPPNETLEPLTRIEVTSAPSTWNADLVLKPGAPVAIETAAVINRWGLSPLWGTIVVLGVLLALALPWAVVPRERRYWTDWLWAVVVGAATGLSFWASALVFLAWMTSLSLRTPLPGRGMRVAGWVSLGLGGGGIGLLILARLLVPGGEAWPDPSRLVLALATLGMFLLITCVYVSLLSGLAWVGGWGRVGWFVLFMVAHGSLACCLFLVLRAGLSSS